MRQQFKNCSLILLLLLVGIKSSFAQQRTLLYPATVSDKLQTIVSKIQHTDTPKIDFAELNQQTDYFVRLIPRQYAVNEQDELQENAGLGTKSFVFFTTPEGIYGKSLLEIYLDIGYEAEDIIRWQHNQEMVALIFRYPETIQVSAVQSGHLPQNWAQYIYIPTWDNIFALFHKLAAKATIEPEKKGEFAPQKLFFRSPQLKNFVLSFPQAGHQRIKMTEYTQLKAVGGADWIYRQLLEDKLSIFEHFRGNGRTLNEIIDPQGIHQHAGLLEFVGPNQKLSALAELAVVYLGALTIEDLFKE